MTTVSHRSANEADAESMAALCRELGYPVTAESMRSRIGAIRASPNDLLILAVDKSDTVAGWLQAHAAHVVESGFRVEITGLVVSSGFRRRGVGRLLVAEAERWAKSMATEAVVVRSNANRVESHSFYPAVGYTCTKTQRVYRKALAGPQGGILEGNPACQAVSA